MQEAKKAAPERAGPRPLPLHLATANMILLSSIAAWPIARRVSPLWNPSLAAQFASLAPALAAVNPNDFVDALMRMTATRLTAMTGGVLRYRHHAYRRDLPDPPVIWQEGSSRLLDFGEGAAGDGVPVVMVPSLVNRAYVLDLAPGQSLARWLPSQGIRPFLLDWGEPGEVERRFNLAAYIARVRRALTAARQVGKGKPVLLGYCMGGNLALAAALQMQDEIAALVLLATPWDFHAGGAHQAALVQALAPSLVPQGDPIPPLDVDVLQGFFWALDPLTALKKFTSFNAMPSGSDNERRFVAMEDWLNDGVPLAGPVARECLLGWYGENTPPKGRWLVDGRPVRPQDWQKPALVALPERDKLVPKEGAAVLLEQLPKAERLDAASGHIGMVVGPRAQAGLWQPLAAWLRHQNSVKVARKPGLSGRTQRTTTKVRG